ncbi:hypothetical protein DFH07DRAFT_958468 [Mycena maculata]|uniref:Uncharacterized protein n=1 Tax=Mycena maculata TaxID=230809 RepID=A0AAD7J6N2_9AGAR|nr:hypothetical protein DFH07DRAFT_958468 [Mycena maculata]
MSAAPELDRSWDVGQPEQTPDGYIATRPRPQDRGTKDPVSMSRSKFCVFVESNPQLTVFSLGHYMDGATQHRNTVEIIFRDEMRKAIDDARIEHRRDISGLEREHRTDSVRVQRTLLSIQNHLLSNTEYTVLFNDGTGEYEIITRFNEVIFNLDRQESYPGDVVLTTTETSHTMVRDLSPLPPIFSNLSTSQYVTRGINALRLRALGILTSQQQRLYRALLEVQESDSQRNFARATLLSR